MQRTIMRRRSGRLRPHALTSAGTVLLALATAAGCGGDDNGGPPTGGGGADAGTDVTTPLPDGALPATDAGADTTQPPVDAGHDTGSTGDASDASHDAGDAAPTVCADDDGDLTNVTLVAGGSGTTFTMPLDAVPDTAGAKVYFTAIAADGSGAVFSGAVGGAVTALAGGLGLPSGIAISDDGATLFVADQASPLATNDLGAIVTLGTGGSGSATKVAGTEGYQPRGVAAHGGSLYFTGIDPASGKPGVFVVSTGGGVAGVVSAGDPFHDPGGVVAAASGAVYVSDTTAGAGGRGAILVVATGGAASIVKNGLSLGFPAGLALSADESTLLGTATVGGGAQLVRLGLTADAGAPGPVSTGAIGTSTEAAGLHRAHGGCSYAFVDSAAGGFGAVYLLTK